MMRSPSMRQAALVYLLLVSIPAALHAAVVSGTVKDSSGALIPNARIEITGGELAQPVILSSDSQGRFASPDLKPGKYSVGVNTAGFEPLLKSIEIANDSVSLDLQLTLASTRQEITVKGNAAQFANTDPVYQQLRNIGLGVSFTIHDFKLHFDVATFEFKRGTLTFLTPVKGVVTGVIFVGEGHLNLKPLTVIDRNELVRRARAEQVDEDFSEIVFRFSGGSNRSFLAATDNQCATPPEAAAVLRRWQERVRQRHEIPLGFSEELLAGEAMDNVDADVLACLYNPARPPFFSAYIRGLKHKDLRFYFRLRGGAIPALGSPEEVALLNYDPEGMEDGVWYLAHRMEEYEKGTASSLEERRFVAARSYKLETVVGNNDHLTSVAVINFEPLISGERVLKFQLLPNLRVTRVADAAGKNLFFIQENRKADGSFYAILPTAAETGKISSITVEYSGDKVIQRAGPGSYYVRARESWYPNLNGFDERSLFDITYRYPKQYKMISVGKLV